MKHQKLKPIENDLDFLKYEVHRLKQDLHEKVKPITDHLDLLIQCRRNYSDDLYTYIQTAFDQNSKYLLPHFKTRRAAIQTVMSDDQFNNRFLTSPNQLMLDSGLVAASKKQCETNGDVMSSRPFQNQKPSNLNGIIQKDMFSEALTARIAPLSTPLNKNLNLLNFKRFKPSTIALKKNSNNSQSSDPFDVISED